MLRAVHGFAQAQVVKRSSPNSFHKTPLRVSLHAADGIISRRGESDESAHAPRCEILLKVGLKVSSCEVFVSHPALQAEGACILSVECWFIS